MLDRSEAYSGFAVNDLETARKFYGNTLGLEVKVLDEENGLMQLNHAGGKVTLCYLKPDLEPGNYTILNFPVENIDAAVEELSGRGVSFERYDGFDQDDMAIARGIAQNRGPDIAWFKDPAGNILSVLQES
jgi:catechol 2,3-dioxygenase-like lactoylglutathione lyase family enzyme